MIQEIKEAWGWYLALAIMLLLIAYALSALTMDLIRKYRAPQAFVPMRMWSYPRT